jgi:hypothetical protein
MMPVIPEEAAKRIEEIWNDLLLGKVVIQKPTEGSQDAEGATSTD